jgi:hypothetical protein
VFEPGAAYLYTLHVTQSADGVLGAWLTQALDLPSLRTRTFQTMVIKAVGSDSITVQTMRASCCDSHFTGTLSAEGLLVGTWRRLPGPGEGRIKRFRRSVTQ